MAVNDSWRENNPPPDRLCGPGWSLQLKTRRTHNISTPRPGRSWHPSSLVEVFARVTAYVGLGGKDLRALDFHSLVQENQRTSAAPWGPFSYTSESDLGGVMFETPFHVCRHKKKIRLGPPISEDGPVRGPAMVATLPPRDHGSAICRKKVALTT